MWIIFPRMTLGVIIHVGVYGLAQGQGTRTLSPGALSGCFGTGLTAFHLYNSTFIAYFTFKQTNTWNMWPTSVFLMRLLASSHNFTALKLA